MWKLLDQSVLQQDVPDKGLEPHPQEDLQREGSPEEGEGKGEGEEGVGRRNAAGAYAGGAGSPA